MQLAYKAQVPLHFKRPHIAFDIQSFILLSTLCIAAQVFFFSLSSTVAFGGTTLPSIDATESLPFAQSTDKSLNWSGYVADGGEFTAVSGSWVIPHVEKSAVLAADATWVGIGGIKNKNLIQAGTQAVADAHGGITYEAWIEELPGTSESVPLKIHEQDTVSVRLTEISPNIWEITMQNDTTGETFRTTRQYESVRASAEWIEEKPQSKEELGLSDFKAIRFITASAIKNGQVLSADNLGAQALSMVHTDGSTLALPTDIGSSGAFRVERSK